MVSGEYMKRSLALAISVVTLFLLCGFQGQTSSIQRKPAPQGANGQKADSGSAPHGAASPGEPATGADKNADAPTAPRQSDKVEVTALPPEIAIKQIRDSIDRTILYCTVVLTIVGVLGTWVAIRTLRAIKKQAEIMDEHRVSLEQLAEAAKDNAAAANKNAEFAKANAEATKENAAAAKANAEATKRTLLPLKPAQMPSKGSNGLGSW